LEEVVEEPSFGRSKTDSTSTLLVGPKDVAVCGFYYEGDVVEFDGFLRFSRLLEKWV